jgi:hypothetical protein
MKKENRILAIINGYKIFVGNHRVLLTSEIKKEMKIILNNYSAHAAPNFLPSTANSVLLGDPVVWIHPTLR